MIINQNISALNTLNRMSQNEKATSSSLAKLSSGLRINSAADDAAGLAITQKMQGQINGLNQATRNAQDGNSMLQTAEGGLNETQSILQRMRELAVQAASDTNTTADRTAMQTEMGQLTSEVDRIANTTEFNTKKLLNGSIAGADTAIAGQGTIDGTFANGAVVISQFVGVSQVGSGFTDVIQINFIAGSSQGAAFSLGNVSITTVLGDIASTAISISAGNSITISQIGVDSTGAISSDVSIATACLSCATAGDSITITITNGKMAINANSALTFQIGANAGQAMRVGIDKMDSTSLGVRTKAGAALDLTTQNNASGAVKLIDNAIQTVSIQRSNLGAYENRLDHTVNNLTTASQNLTSAQSRIQDVDMAAEMTNFQKNNILLQASQAMLAQANQIPQGVLQLLK